MEKAVEIFAIIHFLVIGVSHIIHHRAWAEFFIRLRSKGLPGVFINGFISLGFGSVVVSFHNVWSGLPMILTLFGWLILLKAVVFSFLMPRIAMRALCRVSVERSWEFIPAGVVLLVLAGLLLYGLVSTP